MVEQQSLKVYELAKELGLDSISLLDKLNGLNIKVKSHMSDLGPDEVRTARASLGKRPAPDAVRKTATKTAAAKAPAGAKAPAKTTTKKRASSSDAPPPAATSEPVSPASSAPREASALNGAASAKSASPIIRRRTMADGAKETTIPVSHVSASTRSAAEAAENSRHEQPGFEGEAEETESAHAQSSEATAYEEEAAPAPVSEPESEYTPEPETPAAAASASAAPTAAAPAATPAAGPALTTSAQTITVQTPAPTAGVLGGAKTRPPVVLPPRPVAPRRSVLKIVEPTAPPPRPMVKPTGGPVVAPRIAPRGTTGATTTDRDGFRVLKKENLDQMVEEEAAKKRGGGREPEIRPEDVRFADYRKKEMVFLPRRKRLPVGKTLNKTEKTERNADKRFVEMDQEMISVQDLAAQLSVKGIDIVRKLMGMGQMATINQSIDFDTATLIAAEYKYEVRNVAFQEDSLLDVAKDAEETLISRPPVVTIMGHVDHGKTSLLDAIREEDVAGGEAGGITQHIGAYTVMKDGKLITFVDTPGHEAFTAMRARGAGVTDIVILVVAADDGVMPQTREALSHAQAANVPIIVAVNKIDKGGANPERIRQQLSELNLLAEEWGGQTMFINVSATKKTGLDKLLEAILLQSEVLDLKANPNAQAGGTVLEARLEKGRGPVASVLVKRGTLRVGDAIVSGKISGRVKALTDDKGRNVKEVLPGVAAEVLGFEALPSAGERFDSPENEAAARVIAENRTDKARQTTSLGQNGKSALDDLFSKISAGNVKELNVILKADMMGSVEAIRDALIKASTEKVKIKVILAAPGGITESDVLLGTASGALLIGFNVRPETKARQLAEAEHVEIKTYSVIYELLDDIKKSMVGLLDKKKVEKFLGRAEVRQTFSVPKIGTIAGTSVIDGKIIRGANVRLLRDSRVIYEGKMSSLKRFKDDAKEVAQGFECGIGLDGFNDLKMGDLIEAYQIDMVTPELGA